jgi:hypothetical protein
MALRSSPTGTSFYVLALIGGLPIATLPLLFAFARAKKKELLRHE